MNEKIKALCDLFVAFGVSREEAVSLLQQLREQWKIGIEELVPESKILSGRQRTDTTDQGVSEMLVQRVLPMRKDVVKPENPTVTAKDNFPYLVDLDNTIRLVDAEVFEETAVLRMGKEYSYGIIYRWKPRLYVRSRYILQDLCSEAVCLDYGQAGKGVYRQFAIALTDEIAAMPLKTAEAYAASKLPKLEGEIWKIMDCVQAGIAGREVRGLNRLLNKLGGDPFRGKYATRKVPEGKVRYTINIK